MMRGNGGGTVEERQLETQREMVRRLDKLIAKTTAPSVVATD